MAQKKPTGPYPQLIKGLQKDGAVYCAPCTRYLMKDHGCWQAIYVTAVHHDPIDPGWTELEAEAINAEPLEAA